MDVSSVVIKTLPSLGAALRAVLFYQHVERSGMIQETFRGVIHCKKEGSTVRTCKGNHAPRPNCENALGAVGGNRLRTISHIRGTPAQLANQSAVQCAASQEPRLSRCNTDPVRSTLNIFCGAPQYSDRLVLRIVLQERETEEA